MTTVTGSCLCGAVCYQAGRPLRDVVICHCGMCRKAHGHVGAYTAVAAESFRLVEPRGLRWYRSSTDVRRGFCGECGSTLFWVRDGTGRLSIAAGTLDAPTGLRTTVQIHVGGAGDYYPVDESIPIRDR